MIFCSINTILSPEAPDQFPGAASASATAVSCSLCQRFEMWKCFSISEQVSLEKICLLIHESSWTEVNTRTYTLLLHEEWKRWNTGKEKAYSFDNRGRERRYGAFLTPSSASKCKHLIGLFDTKTGVVPRLTAAAAASMLIEVLTTNQQNKTALIFFRMPQQDALPISSKLEAATGNFRERREILMLFRLLDAGTAQGSLYLMNRIAYRVVHCGY